MKQRLKWMGVTPWARAGCDQHYPCRMRPSAHIPRPIVGMSGPRQAGGGPRRAGGGSVVGRWVAGGGSGRPLSMCRPIWWVLVPMWWACVHVTGCMWWYVVVLSVLFPLWWWVGIGQGIRVDPVTGEIFFPLEPRGLQSFLQSFFQKVFRSSVSTPLPLAPSERSAATAHPPGAFSELLRYLFARCVTSADRPTGRCSTRNSPGP